MAVNQVIVNGETVVDLTSDTVTSADVAEGVTFHLASGASGVGTGDYAPTANGVEFIVGTQTAATNAWTGVSKQAALYDGMQISFWLPYSTTSTSATLDLTMSDGSTTGAKAIYRYSTTTLASSTFAPALSVVHLVYRSSLDRWYHDMDAYPTVYYLPVATASAATKAKTVTATYYYDPKAGDCLPILNRYANTATTSVTMNVASTGAKTLLLDGKAIDSTNYSFPRGLLWLYYDGTNWNLNSDGSDPRLNAKANTADLATVATSGSYNDLGDKPTIPSAVTETTVSGWGFTKNVGTVTSVNNITPTNGNVSFTPTRISDTDGYVEISGGSVLAKDDNEGLTGRLAFASEIPTSTTVSGWGFTKNTGTVTSVNNTSPVDGNVTISIPDEVTETTVSGWGFTKNTGTYSKPSGGIPKTDLASAVQTSLGKADSALQSYTETDPVFTDSVAHGITQNDIDWWDGAVQTVNGTYPDTNGNVALSIPDAVTETTVSGWGFTKNTGTVTSVNNVSPVNGNVTIEVGGGGAEFIVGTQTAATASWTGTSTSISSLTDGTAITYFLPYDSGNSATLNITLKDGTASGAKTVYVKGTIQAGAQYVANSALNLVYHSGAWYIVGSSLGASFSDNTTGGVTLALV